MISRKRLQNSVVYLLTSAGMALAPFSFAMAQSIQSGSQGAIDGPRPTQESVKSAADDTQKANESGSGSNAGIGAGLMAAGAALMSNPPTMPAGIALMAMGMMAMMQSGEQSGTADGAQGVSGLVDYGYTNPNSAYGKTENFNKDGTPTQDFIDKSGLSEAQAKQLLSAWKEAKAQGMKLDPKTGNVTLPNGKTITPEQASTAEGFAGASGLALADTQKAFDTMKEEVAKVTGDGKMVAAMDVDGGGGGGGGAMGSLGSGGGDSSEIGGFGGGRGMASEKDKGKRKLAGMSKNFNGDPIGVSSDDIFVMMTRRYQLKQKQNFFLREDEGR